MSAPPARTSFCQVVKMDVEGWELEVLKGAAGLLQQHNVWFILTGALLQQA